MAKVGGPNFLVAMKAKPTDPPGKRFFVNLTGYRRGSDAKSCNPSADGSHRQAAHALVKLAGLRFRCGQIDVATAIPSRADRSHWRQPNAPEDRGGYIPVRHTPIFPNVSTSENKPAGPVLL